MSSSEGLRLVVRNLADTFNDPKVRESSYFDFYDDSLVIHGFPPNLPTNKEGFKQWPIKIFCFISPSLSLYIKLISRDSLQYA
jgi:hypothetical protein